MKEKVRYTNYILIWSVQTGRYIEKYVFRLVTSVGQIKKKYSESPRGIEPQTYGFRAQMLWNPSEWNPKVWGSISHRDSEFFLCPTLVTRRKTSFLFIYRAQNFTSLLFYLGHYMYIETSSPRVKGETARLVSDRFKIADGHNWCLKFWYHMYGNSVGALKVKLKMYPFNPSKPYYNTKWTDQYNHGDSWLFQQIQLNSADDFEVCWDINLSENWFRNTLTTHFLNFNPLFLLL